jgi:hypothetical protein
MFKLAVAITALLGCALVTPAQAAATLCADAETVLFSCPAGNKTVSVCASKDLDKSIGYLQYRFGPKAAPEIQIPKEKKHPDASVKSNTLVFSGGGGAYLRFTQNGFDYVIYTASGKGWGTKQGVAVKQGEKLVVNVKCTQAAQTELGPDWFAKAGLASDTKDFDLP